MNRIGIDFGTSFCTASWINPRTSQPEAITFHDIGMQKMPSVVFYTPDGVIVGQAAYNQIENSGAMPPEQKEFVLKSVVENIKRNMKPGQYHFLPDGRKVSHEEVIAAILSKIKEESQITCFNNNPVEEVTITHPVVFASWQKDMLKKSAEIAGFKKVTLLEEPVAAAMGYAATANQKADNILVYDFGGGTFDVAFVQCDNRGEFRVPVEPEGDAWCGGNDIDGALYDVWESLAKEKYNRTIDSNPAHIDRNFMLRCRKHKESMTLMPKNNFSELLPAPGFQRLEMSLDTVEFNKIIEPVIDKTIDKTKRLLSKVKDAGYKIDTAIMIGGSSRIPLVYEKLKTVLGVEPRKVMQVDVAVALGAVLNDHIKSKPLSQVKKVFCIYCGRQIDTTDRFCIKCGKPNTSFIKG